MFEFGDSVLVLPDSSHKAAPSWGVRHVELMSVLLSFIQLASLVGILTVFCILTIPHAIIASIGCLGLFFGADLMEKNFWHEWQNWLKSCETSSAAFSQATEERPAAGPQHYRHKMKGRPVRRHRRTTFVAA